MQAPFAATIVFSDSFENGAVGWQFGDNNPAGPAAYWGVVHSEFGSFGARDGTNKLYCAATGHAGTPGNPLYVGGMAASATRTLDLSLSTNATLSFWYTIPSIENVYDIAKVYLDDTELWSRSSGQTNWMQVELSLDAFVGGIRTLSFQFFSDFAVNHEGWYIDDIAVTERSIPGAPRKNDNFASAQMISGANGAIEGNNRKATFEEGEPNSGFSSTNSVWFSWSTFTNGPVTFSTKGSWFDTVLCVYSGTNLASLILEGSDSGSNEPSRVTVKAVAGVSYRISVRGARYEDGLIWLSWNQPNAVVVEHLPDLTVWADPAQNYLYGWYLDTNHIPGHTLLRLSSATANIGQGPLELIGSSMAPAVVQRVYRNDGSFYERAAGTFAFHPDHGHMHVDNWMNFHLRTVLSEGGVGPVIVSGDKVSSALIDLQVYDRTLSGFPTTSRYRGGWSQGLSVGWSDVYGANLIGQWIDVTEVPPGRYWLEEVVDPANHILESNEANNVARILIDLNPGHPGGTPTNYWDGHTPFIRSQPLGANMVSGETLRLSVECADSLSLTYQWQHSDTDLVDDHRISGATTADLTLQNVSPADAGPYTVVIKNSHDSITSAPAILIVLDNPRAIYVEDATVLIGETITIPVKMLARGDEKEITFSLVFDPGVLGRVRVTHGADSGGAAFSMDRTKITEGKLGVHIAFQPGQGIPIGSQRELARVECEVNSHAKDGTVAYIGFNNDPLPCHLLNQAGEMLHPGMAAGRLALQKFFPSVSAHYLPEGQVEIQGTGLPHRNYVLEASNDLGLVSWFTVTTNRSASNGFLSFNDSRASPSPQRFYRTKQLP